MTFTNQLICAIDQKHYAVNCIALNLSPDCWYFVREELALFHAVLYLVSLDYNMKYGLIDSPGSLFHGREAFRLINEAIKDNAIRDTLIAAVSLVITREVSVPYGLGCLSTCI